ncbi:hypothetical protein BFJ70_g11726 [Fusarium oxysporum]|nr:hypothetical protein BFJ70_g11726 [Fusarium oxysporum]
MARSAWLPLLVLHVQLFFISLFAWPTNHVLYDTVDSQLEVDAGTGTDRTSILTGSKRVFDLTITWEDYTPDGFTRKMVLVNGQSAGPLIDINEGDRVSVTVFNKSPFNTTIHYHGIDMADTPWSDGVPGATQRPIRPGDSFIYEFKATQYGSYWYHSHFHGQIEDGLYGPILIRPRRDKLEPFHLISTNVKVQRRLEEAKQAIKPLLVSDFTHLTSIEKWKITQEAGIEISCYDSILFNGKGHVQCPNMNDLNKHLSQIQRDYLATVPGASITDKGEWVAIDIIGGFSFITAVMSIDEHDMWVYAVDGSYVEPQKVQAITVSNGDRYSVFVNTKNAGKFKIRCSSVNIAQILVGHAILSVCSKNSTTVSTPFIDIAGRPTSPEVKYFDQAIAHPFPPEFVAAEADAFFPLSMQVDGASYLWAMNHTRLMPTDIDAPVEPVLFAPAVDKQNNVTITTKLNTWVDLLFFTGSEPMPPHPIHKHGNKMFQIGSWVGHFKWNSTEEALKDIPENFNLVNPLKRDGFASLTAFGNVTWVVVRYHVTNPGAWLLHCHIDNHLQGGMMMIIQDGVDHWPRVPDHYLSYGQHE